MTAADAIELAYRTWTYEPAKARAEQSVTAFSHGKEAILFTGGVPWRSSLPSALGGGEGAPSPTQLLLGALASSAVLLIKDTLAPQLGIDIEAVEATACCETDDRALLGMDGLKPQLRCLRVELEIKSPDGDAAVEKISAA